METLIREENLSLKIQESEEFLRAGSLNGEGMLSRRESQ